MSTAERQDTSTGHDKMALLKKFGTTINHKNGIPVVVNGYARKITGHDPHEDEPTITYEASLHYEDGKFLIRAPNIPRQNIVAYADGGIAFANIEGPYLYTRRWKHGDSK